MGEVIAAARRVVDRSARLALPIEIRRALFGEGDNVGLGKQVRMVVRDGVLVVTPFEAKPRAKK